MSFTLASGEASTPKADLWLWQPAQLLEVRGIFCIDRVIQAHKASPCLGVSLLAAGVDGGKHDGQEDV